MKQAQLEKEADIRNKTKEVECSHFLAPTFNHFSEASTFWQLPLCGDSHIMASPYFLTGCHFLVVQLTMLDRGKANAWYRVYSREKAGRHILNRGRVS